MRKIRWYYILIMAVILILITVSIFRAILSSHSELSHVINDSGSEKVNLEFYVWADEKTYMESVVKAYNAFHPDVLITLHVLENLYYDDVLKELLAGDTRIDLFGVRGISLLVQMKAQNLLLDLTPYIKSNNMDVTAYGSMFNDILIDGHYYGMPTRSTCWIMLYNKDIFDAAGIAYPGQMTWDEYRSLALTLTSGKGKDKIYGGYWAPWIYNFAAIQRSAYLIDDDLSYTRESLEMLNNFYNVDQSHVSYKQMAIQENEFDYRSYFESGNIAMMPQGEWMINMLIEDRKNGLTDVNWDIAPMPVFEGQDSKITWGQYQYVSISEETPHPEEAFAFLQFLCGEEGARIYAENGIIHAYRSDEVQQIYLNAVGKESASIFYEAKRVQEELAVPNYQEVVAAFKECAVEYLLGNITIDKAMADFEEKRNRIYQREQE